MIVARLAKAFFCVSKSRKSSGMATIRGSCSYVEAEMHDVAVLDDVVGAFEPHPAGILGALLAAMGDKIRIGDGFGADKALLEIGVDGSGGLRRLSAAGDRPGARLLRPGGQERDQVEQCVAGADDLVEPGLGEAERSEEFAPLSRIGEHRQL